MTTKRDTPTIGTMLKRRRGSGSKSAASREVGVSRQIYDAWEHGLYVPGDEWAEPLSVYLNHDLRELVWLLYVERVERVERTPGGWMSAHNPRSVTHLRVVRPTDNRPPTRKAA